MHGLNVLPQKCLLPNPDWLSNLAGQQQVNIISWAAYVYSTIYLNLATESQDMADMPVYIVQIYDRAAKSLRTCVCGMYVQV